MQQCIEAVDYCHQRNVAHRDLKLDNTLLDTNDPPHVKICDFGFAKLMGPNATMTTGLGTAVYMAPQQIKKGADGYDGKAAGAPRVAGLSEVLDEGSSRHKINLAGHLLSFLTEAACACRRVGVWCASLRLSLIHI